MVANAIYNPTEIKQQIAELKAEAAALVENAKTEDRELTEEELNRFNAIINDESGEVPKLEAKLVTAERVQKLQQDQIKAQLPDRPVAGPGTELVEPGSKPRISFGIPRNRLQVFKGKDGDYDAYVFGQWLLRTKVVSALTKCKIVQRRIIGQA